MSTEVSRNGTPDTSVIDALLRRARTLLRSSWIVTGAGLTLGLLLATALLTTLTDLVVPMGTVLRLMALLVVVVPSVWALVTGVIRPLLRRLTRQHMARRVEAHLPNIHNRLVSAVDLTEQKSSNRVSQAFYVRLVTEAIERIKGFVPSKVVDAASLRKSLIFAGSTILGLILAMAVLSDRLPTALARIANPFEDLPPATGVKYVVYPHAPDGLAEVLAAEVPPGNYKGLKGDPITFTVIVRKGRPEKLRLKINTVDDDDPTKKITLWHDLKPIKPPEESDEQVSEEQRWSLPFPLTGMRTSFTYRVYGGGTWSKKYRVDLLDRPQINSLQTRLHYPEYMGIKEPKVGALGSADVSGPIGSRVELSVEVEGEATQGDIELLQTRFRKVPQADRPERFWLKEKLPAGASAIGTWVWDSKTIAGKKLHSNAPAKAMHNHGFQNAAVPFKVSRDDALFAYVLLDPKQTPDCIMLQWHDGSSWEHRAYWGKEKLLLGKSKTVGRYKAGDLPATGKLVRLEIPAESVGLQGSTIRGMQFTAFGGKCSWYGGGALPMPYLKVPELYAVKAYPLVKRPQQDPDRPVTVWHGDFPLNRNGWYRVVMSNGINIRSRPMKEARITAIEDQPPRVILERPGVNLIVSQPIKVPLFISAYDDFGLSEVVLSIQVGKDKGFEGRPLKSYTRVQRSDTTAITLDLAKEELKLGESIKYRVEVRDRKGQSSQTADFTVTYAKAKKAADTQLDQFEANQETVRDKLVKLINDQEEVKKKIDKLTEEFKPLTEKIDKARAEQQQKQEQAKNDQPKDTKKKPTPPQTKPEELPLDKEAVKQLADLKKQIAETAKQQDANVKQAEDAAKQLQNLSKTAPDLQLLAPEIGKQLQAINKAFEKAAVKPTQELSKELKKRTDAKKQDPALKQLKQMSDRVQKDLNALKDRLDAVAEAEKKSRENVTVALDELQNKINQQDAQLTADDLKDLAEYIKALRKDLKNLSKEQQALDAAKTQAQQKKADLLKKALKDAENKLNKKTDQQLDKAKKLLGNQPQKPQQTQPDPQNIQPPDGKKAAGKKDNGKKADGKKEDAKGKQADGKKQDAAKNADDPALFLPALGAKQGKKSAKKGDAKLRPQQAAQKPSPRQQQLDSAELALAQDQQTLQKMMKEIRQAVKDAKSPQQRQALADQLSKLLQSQKMQQAQAMLNRLRQMLAPQPAQNQPNTPQTKQPPENVVAPTPSALTDLAKDNIKAQIVKMKLADRDLAEKTVILKMQPKMREELLKGLKQVGPKGYRKFIRDYFRRLTKVKKKK